MAQDKEKINEIYNKNKEKKEIDFPGKRPPTII